MSLLKPLGSGQGYLKAGIQGFASSGKTFTATSIAIGLRDMMNLKGPIAFFDTEGGAEYIAHRVKAETGLDLVGTRSQAFQDLIDATKEAEREGVSVLIVDSISHVWNELQKSHIARVNENLKRRNRPQRYNLEFQDWGPIKTKWAEWTSLFLNSRLHIIFCGRAAFTYDHEINEDTGKKDLVKTGTKMRAENEFGYEPSLLIEMEAIKQKSKKGAVIHRATVLKDRFDEFNGQQFDNPTFKTFLAHFERLKPGAHAPIDTSIKTEPLIDEEGHDDRRRREILCEEIQGEIVDMYPGQTAAEKQAKAHLIFETFNTRSWTAVEGMSLEQLRTGLSRIRSKRQPAPNSDSDLLSGVFEPPPPEGP